MRQRSLYPQLVAGSLAVAGLLAVLANGGGLLALPVVLAVAVTAGLAKSSRR